LLKLLDNDAKYVNNRVKLDVLDGVNITITGATGLVGLNIICALNYYNKNYAKRRININALSYSKPSGIIKKIFEENGINSIIGDLSDCSFVENLPLSDCIIHSAGYGQPGKFMDDKIKTISINTSATISLSKRLREGGRFLFLSSSEVYSGCPGNKNTEYDIGVTAPDHVRSCYIEGKRSGEAIVNILRENGIQAASARLALAYGPGVKSNDERVLNQFIQKGINGSIELLDSGSAMRTYGYIADVVVMLLNILIKNSKSVYNVGGHSVISIKDLAIKIGQQMSVDVKVPESKSSLKGAPQGVGLDLSRVEEEFNHKEYIGIDQGLRNTIEWIKNYE
jgi:nucleoside-diphosphate-sugar epimerase